MIDPNISNQIAANITSSLNPIINNSINLTGEITAILVQPRILETTAIIVSASVLSGIMGGFIALFGVRMTQSHNDKREAIIRKEENAKLRLQKQWEIFSKLKGIQSALSQDYLDVYQTSVFAICQEAAARLHMNSEENQRLHLNEAKTLLIALRENKRLFSKDRRELHETIGSILLLFPNEPKLHEKINPIYSHVSIFESKFNNDNFKTDLEALIPDIFGDLKVWGETFDPSSVGENFKIIETWKINKIKEINKLAVEIVCQQLLDLLNYLQEDISSTED